MKHIFTFTIVILFSLHSFSQKLKVSFGEILPSPYSSRILDAGMLGDKLLVITAEKNYKMIKFYNPTTMKLVTSKVFQQNSCKGINDCIDNDFSYRRTLYSKDHAIMIFNSYEKNSKQNILFAQKVKKDGSFDGKLVILDKIDADSRRNSGNFLIWQSADSSKFMIIQNPPFDRYQGEKFNFKVYNNNLENLSNFGASLPYKDEDVTISDYYLGNDGTIYLLVRVFKADKERGQDRSFYTILSTNGTTGSFAEFQVKLPDRDIETIALRLDDKNKKVICAGLYSDITKGYTGKKVDGLFFLKVDIAKNAIESSGYQKIDNAVLAAILNVSEKKIDKKGKAGAESKNFEIRDILTHSDGSSTLITEYRLLIVTTTTTTSSNGTTTTTTTYHYYRKNIFVIRISPDGSILSFTDIPKYQKSTNDDGKFLSFLLTQKDDKIIMIYNDNPENMSPSVKTIKDVKIMPHVSKASVVAVELNKDGTYSKQVVYTVPEKKVAMLPEKGIMIGNGKYIVPIEKAPGKMTCGCVIMFSKLKSGLMKVEL